LTTDGFEGLIKRGYLRTIKRRTVATLACVTDFVSFTCVYAGPVVKTAHVLSVGEPELAKQMTTLTKVWLDDSLSAFGATGTAKSVEEAIDYRVRFAAAALEKAMAQSNKIAETLISKCHWGDRTLLKSE
jgi:hypothetical protein